MLQNRLFKDGLIDMSDIPDLTDARRTVDLGEFQEYTSPLQMIQYSKVKAVGDSKANTLGGNFRWLAYIPGAISYESLSDVDILTGPMTGCWVVIFKRDNKLSVAHIGTVNTPDSKESVAVKKGWGSVQKKDLIGGFNPASIWNGGNIPDAATEVTKGSSLKIFGLVTTDQACFSVVTWRNTDGKTFRVAGIEQMHPVTDIFS
jgi:hypothetical protein